MRNLSSPPLSDKNSSNQFNPSNMSFYCVAKSNELEVHELRQLECVVHCCSLLGIILAIVIVRTCTCSYYDGYI